MSEPKYLPPEKFTCATCIHFRPEIVYTHKGKPLTAWYGLCAILPLTRCETAHTCPYWAER